MYYSSPFLCITSVAYAFTTNHFLCQTIIQTHVHTLHKKYMFYSYLIHKNKHIQSFKSSEPTGYIILVSWPLRPLHLVSSLCKALASPGTETLLAWVSPATQGLPVNQCTAGLSGLTDDSCRLFYFWCGKWTPNRPIYPTTKTRGTYNAEQSM